MSVFQPSPGERVRDVHVTEDTLAVDLLDGITIIVPLAWYPRLLDATAEQRSQWKIAGAGYGIHWPELDGDLSTEGRQIQALVDEALADLIEKRKKETPRAHVMGAYLASHEKYSPLYKKLAE